MKKFLSILALWVIGLGSTIAAPVLPSVTDAGWVTDRYGPAIWQNIGPYQGRSNVLQIGIDGSGDADNRLVGQQSTFYNTQGRQIAASGGVGDSLVASLWLDESFRDNNNGSNYVRTDLWGRAGGTESETTYSISGFTNYGGAARFRVYDADTAGGWVDLTLSLASLYNTWVDFEILATVSGYEYYINDALVYTDNIVGSAGSGFTRAFLQAYNFNDPALDVSDNADYVVHWSDQMKAVPTPGTLPLVGLALGGLALPFGRRQLETAKTKDKARRLAALGRCNIA